MIKPAMIQRIPTTAPVVAFTFDDGPHPVYTPQLLDIFQHVGGNATFFMIGQQIDAHPATAATVHAVGHEIGNHTLTHRMLTQLAPGGAERHRSTRTCCLLMAGCRHCPRIQARAGSHNQRHAWFCGTNDRAARTGQRAGRAVPEGAHRHDPPTPAAHS